MTDVTEALQSIFVFAHTHRTWQRGTCSIEGWADITLTSEKSMKALCDYARPLLIGPCGLNLDHDADSFYRVIELVCFALKEIRANPTDVPIWQRRILSCFLCETRKVSSKI